MIFTLNAWSFQIEGEHYQEISSKPDPVFVLTTQCVPSGPRSGPEYLGSPPSLHQQRPEEEEREERELGPGQWPIRGQYPGPGTNQRPALGKWGKLAAGRAVLTGASHC